MANYKILTNMSWLLYENVDVSVGSAGELELYRVFTRSPIESKQRVHVHVIFAPGKWERIELVEE